MLPFSSFRTPILAMVFLCCCAPCLAGSLQVTSGYNLGVDGPVIGVPYQPQTNSYVINMNLVFDPKAGPMTKNFQSPIAVTGAPILLDATQPFPLPVNEDFFLPGGTPNKPVTDWHEHIVTPGWIWILPGDPSFPSLFPQGTSLITRDGQPWTSTPITNPNLPPNPNRVDVLFAPITQDHVLDIHKALLFVGTANNRIWGDTQDETTITVVEYPTPEPSSLVLTLLAAAGLLASRKRWRT